MKFKQTWKRTRETDKMASAITSVIFLMLFFCALWMSLFGCYPIFSALLSDYDSCAKNHFIATM